MANTKEIQKRMKSISDTMKITNAMYIISSTKLQHAKSMLADTEPYFYSLQQEFGRILRHVPETDNIYFRQISEDVSPDKKRCENICLRRQIFFTSHIWKSHR